MVRDIVLIADQGIPRNQWSMGRVFEVSKGNDGLVRRVKLHVGSRNIDNKGRHKDELSVLERPIQKLILLLESDWDLLSANYSSHAKTFYLQILLLSVFGTTIPWCYTDWVSSTSILMKITVSRHLWLLVLIVTG